MIVPWRACLDHHGAFETDEGVGDFAMIMPGNALPGSKRKHLDPKIRSVCDQFAMGDLVIAACVPRHPILLVELSSVRSAAKAVRRRGCRSLADLSTCIDVGIKDADYNDRELRQDAGNMVLGARELSVF
jgi:hypothetical protein